MNDKTWVIRDINDFFSQPLAAGERSELQTRIAPENVFVVQTDEKLRTFLELESAAAIQLVRLPWRQG